MTIHADSLIDRLYLKAQINKWRVIAVVFAVLALLIAVGRHHPEKRLSTIIKAVSRAQKQRKIGLYIAGDGFLRASVERWALNARNVYVAVAGTDLLRMESGEYVVLEDNFA